MHGICGSHGIPANLQIWKDHAEILYKVGTLPIQSSSIHVAKPSCSCHESCMPCMKMSVMDEFVLSYGLHACHACHPHEPYHAWLVCDACHACLHLHCHACVVCSTCMIACMFIMMHALCAFMHACMHYTIQDIYHYMDVMHVCVFTLGSWQCGDKTNSAPASSWSCIHILTKIRDRYTASWIRKQHPMHVKEMRQRFMISCCICSLGRGVNNAHFLPLQ